MTLLAKPFVIGLKPLSLADWLYVPDDLQTYLAEKERLYALHPDLVFFAEEGTEESQGEIAFHVINAVMHDYPERYVQPDYRIVVEGQRTVDITADQPDLLTASQLIADDLVIMRKSSNGWRLVAASLSFPSSWSLAEKAGLPLTEIHQPVPGFGAGTRNAEIISRLFDNLEPDQSVIRQNWSLYPEGDLYHPDHNTRDHGEDEEFIANPFIRTERQTLRKMPESGDILFTIGIEVKRLSDWPQTADYRLALSGLAVHLEEMNEDQTRYKGLTATRKRLAKTLRAAAL